MVIEKQKAKKEGASWFPPPNPADDKYDYEGSAKASEDIRGATQDGTQKENHILALGKVLDKNKYVEREIVGLGLKGGLSDNKDEEEGDEGGGGGGGGRKRNRLRRK